MSGRKTAPGVPLPASEYFAFDTALPDPIESWLKYTNFCRNRGGNPPSTIEQFHLCWKAEREKYRVRRERLSISTPTGGAR